MKKILFSFLLSAGSVVVFAQNSAIVSANSSIPAQNNSMPSRLSMTPTTARQTQGQTFGEKVNQAAQAETRTYTGGRKNEPQAAVVSSGIGGMSKAGGAVSSSYAAGRVAGKDTDVKGEKKQDAAREN